MWTGADVALTRRFEGREVGREILKFVDRICPIFLACLPKRAQALFIRDRVLDNDGADTLWVAERHAKADRPTIILHEQNVVRDPKLCRKFVRHLREIVESVLEVGWRGRAAVAEAGIIGGDEMIFVGEKGQQRLPHPRLGRKAMKHEHGWRISRPGLAVENL